jgi:hypothetical protein
VAPFRLRADEPLRVAAPKVPDTVRGVDTVTAPKVAPAPIVTRVYDEMVEPDRVEEPEFCRYCRVPDPPARPPATIKSPPSLSTRTAPVETEAPLRVRCVAAAKVRSQGPKLSDGKAMAAPPTKFKVYITHTRNVNGCERSTENARGGRHLHHCRAANETLPPTRNTKKQD